MHTTETTTEEDYLIREPEAEYKSEYRDGRVVAMAGAGRRHGLIVTNLTVELGQKLKGTPCELFVADMRLHVKAASLFTYPDLMVVCAKPEMHRGREDTITNPVLIVEVLSKSTEKYDRGQKFEYYKKLDSLREYVLVAQERASVERFTHLESGEWEAAQYQSLDDLVDLPSVACSLTVRDIYDKVPPLGHGD